MSGKLLALVSLKIKLRLRRPDAVEPSNRVDLGVTAKVATSELWTST